MFNFFKIFKKKSLSRKTEAEWTQELFLLPKAQLQNIVNNPGEFVVEMRHAAAQILSKRNGT